MLAPAGVDNIITRIVDDPAANAAKWKKLPYLMDYEDPGTPKPGAAVLANMITPEGRTLPLLITENFGHGRTAIMATGGSWRWQMSSPLGDTAHDLFWQQLLRWVVSDTPGHVTASVPAQILLDNGAVTLTARQKIIYSLFHNRFWEGHGFSRAATTGITLGFSPTALPSKTVHENTF